METIIAKVVNVGQLETYEYSNSQSQVKETGYSRDVMLTTLVPASGEQGVYPKYEHVLVQLRGKDASNCPLIEGMLLTGVVEHSVSARRDGNGWFGRTTMRRYAILAPDTFDAIPIYK